MTIEIIVDGVVVRGQVKHFGPWDMTVELVEPYSGLHRDLHLMNLARTAPELRYGFLSVYGEKRAGELLRELYETGKSLYDRSPTVDLIKPFLKRVQSIEMTEEEYRRRRTDLRRQLRDGAIDNNQHSMLQQSLKREKDNRDAGVGVIKDKFVAAHVSSATSRSLRDQVWNTLVAMMGRER